MRRLKPEQLGVCSWSLRPRSVEQLIEQANELGLHQIQLALDPETFRPNGRWIDTQSKLNRAGIRIGSGMFSAFGENYSTLESIRKTGGFDPDEPWERNLQRLRIVVPRAKSLGLTLVSCHAGFIPPDPSDPGFAKLLGRVGQIAGEFAKAGVTLLLETGQETAETLLGFLDALKKQGTPNVGVNFDPANMILYGMGDPVASLKKLLPRVKQVHIKDALPALTPGDWGQEVPVGRGAVDWRAFMQLLDDSKFKGYLMIEREAGDNRIQDIQTAHDFISSLMRL